MSRRWSCFIVSIGGPLAPFRSCSHSSQFHTQKKERLGVVDISSRNINEEMASKVPLFLYFHVTNNADVASYTERLAGQVDATNRRLQNNNMAEVYQEFGKDRGLAIKLGLVDCVRNGSLTQQFNVDPHMFPIVYFVRNKIYADKMVGIVPESQVKEAIDAFIEYSAQESKNEMEGTSVFQKVKRSDEYDENAMTLLNAAHTRLKNKDIPKARELFQKAYDVAVTETDAVCKRLGISKEKKVTPEMWEALKREGSYNASPQALCGLAMCAMASKDSKEAQRIVLRIREEFPFATRDLRDVAEAVVRIELLVISDFDVEKDTYATLLTYDDLTKDPAALYRQRLKLAVAHFVEKRHHKGIEECLRLIRAEPKLLSALKEAEIVPKDTILGPTTKTPARQVIVGIFEALGNSNEHTIKGRELLQAYL
ncbi:hypothetical protein, conserved [Trypanosoma brucei brucei TREU927]|uniref:Thioredoxin domain-containing protein n=2 Tax=Trypanosoma brucei TaxID=5691 RepID=Q57UB1_TRYB2|nr:hypothetical protein, conserved [Trypanosoma brucei brucei TREU927]AAX70808.1 hypothetical protein, conserved [Trypanosoma brucei]AAZ11466.1 hypothetical protein, conserved [Trypanosoma brucei brucei TREU927]RHW72431.1 hypothetical protein DPX39_050042000 [Trypanosoma brucei equiperdum]